MAFTESVSSEQPAQAFSLYVPFPQQAQMDLLPADTRHTLLGELFQMAVQAARERDFLPRAAPVTLEFQLAGCDVRLELDAERARLTLVSLSRTWH
ncbi:hypothetical protein CYFUS_000053 [Cystobacter fuscus]|uniref:Uncharacterized protein n=1 Tax=Cystobacter fuscus TaxID=43 RepID=A0A250IUN9_9BACT|nr:hypothetical protein [Cystobacter fuscus]ATB34646.1 hypothetical protein CYFUS_000053 [Cystobacter fuscus]